MARILLTWELGSGLSHVVNVSSLANRLVQQGHEVVVALRDLSRAVHGRLCDEVRVVQAPAKVRIGAEHIESPPTFAHVLHNVGFGDPDELHAMLSAWRNLYRWIRPDAIVFDHSPTALLAAGSEPARRILLGIGFYCPPDQAPMPRVRPPLPGKDDAYTHIEAEVLSTVNAWRERSELAPWERLSQLFADVDDNILTTFDELDPYVRTGATYWGIGPSSKRAQPEWPTSSGQKIFAYLKPFPALPALLTFLNKTGHATLIYGDGIDPKLQAHFQSGTLQFVKQPTDFQQAARGCDLAILNGSHASTAGMLLAGKPILQIPITGEQYLIAQRTTALGCGPSVPCNDAETIVSGLTCLIESREARSAARRFAARYDGFDPQEQLSQIAARVGQLATSSAVLR